LLFCRSPLVRMEGVVAHREIAAGAMQVQQVTAIMPSRCTAAARSTRKPFRQVDI